MTGFDWLLLATGAFIMFCAGMAAGVHVGAEATDNCQTYVVLSECPYQEPVAVYVLGDGENIVCSEDNAVVTKVMEVW